MLIRDSHNCGRGVFMDYDTGDHSVQRFMIHVSDTMECIHRGGRELVKFTILKSDGTWCYFTLGIRGDGLIELFNALEDILVKEGMVEPREEEDDKEDNEADNSKTGT